MRRGSAVIAWTGLMFLVGFGYYGGLQGAEPEKLDARVVPKLETSLIEKIIGKAGELKGDVYKISLPRTDLTVMVRDVTVKPSLALESWIAFKATGEQVVVDGDLVLTEDEVAPVIRKLEQEGLGISALHNHLIHESPRIMYLHIIGKGDARRLATSIKFALNLTKTPIAESSARAGEAAAQMTSEESGLNAEKIQEALGQKGQVKGGVLHISLPRSEHIKMSGVTLPPSMGMATSLNFQEAGEGKVAATGDFVMTKEEVDPVSKALTENGIAITALHNHLVHGSPELFFMHFWAQGAVEKVASGLKAGLNAMKLKE